MRYFKSEESEQRYKDAKKRAGETVRKRNKEKYYNNPLYCIWCGDMISYDNRKNKKFCNRSCSASYNNKDRAEQRYCLGCSKLLSNRKGIKKYCSKICQHNHQYLSYINRWKLGIEKGWTGKAGISSHIRRYLHEKYDSKCQKCGWGVINEHTGKVPIQIHHIDGNYKNNEEENLELICPNCHTLTKNFGRRGNNNNRTHR